MQAERSPVRCSCPEAVWSEEDNWGPNFILYLPRYEARMSTVALAGKHEGLLLLNPYMAVSIAITTFCIFSAAKSANRSQRTFNEQTNTQGSQVPKRTKTEI